MNKRFCFFSLFLLPWILLFANIDKDTVTYVIKGRLIEAGKEQVMAYADVRLLRSDSTFITGVHTNEEGLFRVKPPKEGSYLLAIGYMGYEPIFQAVHILKEQLLTDLETLTLQPIAILLKDMEVVAAQQQITMRGDTLVYHADAFRVPPGATLGTLLSRLPGITIEGGVLKYQGKPVNKLLINGKEFFSGDMSVALENLPTEIVETIEAYGAGTDTDKEKNTDSGESIGVLNVTIKKEYKGTWIGNTDLAEGTSDHYSARLFLTRFTDKLSLSAFGQLNNLNDQSEANAGGGWGDNNGWIPGLNTFRKAGVNAAWDNGKKEWQDGYLKIYGNGRFSHNSYSIEEETVGETFYPGASHNYSNSLHGHRDTWSNVAINGGATWKIDSLTTVTTRVGYEHNDQHYRGYDRSATFSADPYLVPGVTYPLASLLGPQPNDSLMNIAINSSDSKSKRLYNTSNFSMSLSAGRRLSLKGHRLDFWTSFRTSENNTTSFSLSNILYYKPDAAKPEQVNNQYSLSPNESMGFDGQLTYEHVLNKMHRVSVAYVYSYSYSQSDYTLFQLDSLEAWRTTSHAFGSLPPPDSLDITINWDNCNYTTYRTHTHGVNLQYRFYTKSLSVTASVYIRPNHTKMDYWRGFMDTTVISDRFYITPVFSGRYRFKKGGYVQLQYQASRNFPGLTQMLDITDDRNPLYIWKGNPDLDPSWTQRYSFNFEKTYGERKAFVWANGNYVTSNSAVSNTETYDPTTGVRTAQPENVDGPWSTYLSSGSSIPLDKKKRWNFYPSIYLGYRESVGYFRSTEDNVNQKSTQRNFSCTPALNLNFRLDKLYLSTNNNIAINAERNSLQPASNQTSRILNTGITGQYEFSWGMTLSSDFHLYSCRGFSSSTMNNDQWLWNAALSQAFLKKQNLILSVNANDILASRLSEWARSSLYGRSSTHHNSFHDMSYVMFHVVYRFNVGKKANPK